MICKMNFKEIAYKSTGPILQVGGAAYMIYGMISGKTEAVVEGFAALMAGQLVSQRTKYVTNTIDRLNKRVSELEEKLEGM